ncbi:MAG: nucleoside-diphosphate kinase [Candidatus Micrarchaeota archaeon]|nr:nucleoside-diphosphate kinase [Candidatus Micrarchaeota archaeon]
MERTVILIKPDALDRGIAFEVASRFEKMGFKIVAVKMVHMTPNLSKEHYSHLVEKPFYPNIEAFMTSKPVIAMILEGKDAVNVVRKRLGKTNAREAEPGTIRGDYSMSTQKNLIHASDSIETAEKEIKRFFKPEEIFTYSRANEESFYARDEL